MKLAISGMGSIGRRHLCNARRLMNNVEIIAIDPAPDARRWAAADGVSRIFQELGQALETRPDAVLVCSPSGQHLTDLRACVDHQVHAYVEKPLAPCLTPAVTACLRDAAGSGCTVVVAANMRYEPGALELTRLVESGRLGRLVGLYMHAGAYLPDWAPNRSGRDYRRSYSASAVEGGALLDFIHEFDLLRLWGGDVLEVSARVRQASDLQIESEDVGDVLVAFECGAVGTVHVDYLERRPRRCVEVLFTEGRAVWDVLAQRVEVVDAAGELAVPVDEPDYDLDASYRAALRDFLLALDATQPPLQVQSGWDAAAAVAIVDAVREASRRRVWVPVAEVQAPKQLAAARSPQPSVRHPRSAALLARARRVIPAMTQTMSKAPSQFVQGVSPAYLERGQGCRVWDADGHEYIDWAMALGPIILGYHDPDVDAAVARQLADGPILSLMHPLEVETAELLAEVLPGAESVRFLKTGSGACSAAVRVARAYTGRDVIASCGYHGWHDWYAGLLPSRRGVPRAVRDLVVEFTFNDIHSLERCFEQHPGQIAAVFMEPMCAEWPKDDFLQRARDLAHEQGALFVLDEVVTGFRWALGGAQEYFKIQADLAVYGKAMANGLPLSALAGRRDVMAVLEDGAFVSLTHGGETLSLAAAKATIEKLRDTDAISGMWAQGRRLRDSLQELLKRHELAGWFQLAGPDCRFEVRPNAGAGVPPLVVHSVLQQELMRRGIFFDGGHVLCAAHDDQAIARTLEAYDDAGPVVASALNSGNPESCLEGPAVQPVFRPRRMVAMS